LIVLNDAPDTSASFPAAARARGIPLTILDPGDRVLHERLGVNLVLVR
jgi:hypothetical protein